MVEVMAGGLGALVDALVNGPVEVDGLEGGRRGVSGAPPPRGRKWVLRLGEPPPKGSGLSSWRTAGREGATTDRKRDAKQIKGPRKRPLESMVPQR